MSKLFWPISVAWFFCSSVLAGVIQVPNDQLTIQAGINAAIDGDTVLVADGTYRENVNFIGKAITVASLFLLDGNPVHIDSTIIDGSLPADPDSGSVMFFISGEDSNSILCGFTLTKGSGTRTWWTSLWLDLILGGGVFCQDSSPTIKDLIITNNCDGGLIRGSSSSIHMENVKITKNNNGFSNHGGGLYLKECNPTLKNVEISYNITDDWLAGGGIYCDHANPHLSNTKIHHNITGAERGGGIYFDESRPTFDPTSRCNIYLNVARGNGNDVAGRGGPLGLSVIVDTFTVAEPSMMHAVPLEQFSFDILHHKIVQEAADLYIDPLIGNDTNSGLTGSDPLKTITMGLHKAIATSTDPRTLYLAGGSYAPQTEFYFPIFLRSNLSLVGEMRDATILDAEGHRQIFSSHGDTNILLSDMTLTGCTTVSQWSDACVLCYGSEMVINNVAVVDNQTIGICIRNWSDASVNGCLLSGNYVGGLECWHSSVALTADIVSGNEGYGILVHEGSDATLNDVTIQNNRGGLSCVYNSNLYGNDIHVVGNESQGGFRDGTVCISNSTVHLSNSVIAENKLDGRGGGIYIGGSEHLDSSWVELSSVLIANNEASSYGGGVFIDTYANILLSDVTISQNSADQYGGGICFTNSSHSINTYFDSANRCNIYSNDSPSGSDLSAQFFGGVIDVVVDTFTVLEPTAAYAYPLEKFEFDILHGYDVAAAYEDDSHPMSFCLEQNYPNPFNSVTRIAFSLPQQEHVTLSVINLAGERVATLFSKKMAGGSHHYDFDAGCLASGIYFYHLESESFKRTKRLLLLE